MWTEFPPIDTWMVIVGLMIGIVGYIFVTLTTTSGSAYSDNTIDAFIVQDEDSEIKQSSAENAKDKYSPDYDCEGRQVLVLFGTEYGFSEEIARKLFDRIVTLDKDFPLQPRIVNAKYHEYINWEKEHVCFFIISTSGDGVPPSDARDFCENMMSSQMCLSHIQYSVLALGDSNYPHFCKTGRDLHARLQNQSAECVVSQMDVDMEDWSVIDHWMDNVLDFILHCEIQPKLDYLHITEEGDSSPNRHKPFMAVMKLKKLLTKHSSDADEKQTIHCEFDVTGSSLTWISGDALGIYPENNPDHVNNIIHMLDCQAAGPFETPSWAYKPSARSCDLHTLLQKYYDLKQVKPELLNLLLDQVTDNQQRETIKALLKDGTSKNNKLLQNYLAEREIIDVLTENNSVKLSPQQLLPCLRPLQPRYYSVSSSPKHDSSTVCVTAAVVRYELLGNKREGVATTFLADRFSEGKACPVFISRNPDFRLPSVPSVPVVLIGPGTGIAPFRAFIQERELDGAEGLTYLYFGCRHRDGDYLYKDELEKWERKGVIKLRTAFSRDQKEKNYVQNLLEKDSVNIWKIIHLDGGHIYICGDGKHMAKDVHNTLTEICKKCGALDTEAATEFLSALEKQGRYQKDVWIT